jgi:hypothetical protein
MVYKRRPRTDCIEIAARLERLRDDPEGKLLPDGQLARPLNRQEEEFINSERILCKLDFEYYFTRYHQIELDPGVGEQSGIGAPILLESQRRFITLVGRREEQCYAEHAKHKFTQGIRVYVQKVRQVAATATFNAMGLHRMVFWPGTRAFAASLDETRVGELFKRTHLALDKLPFWMKPRVYPDVKDRELGFEPPTSSRMSFQAENQQAGGIGVGTQQDVSHLTEVALWQYPGRINFSFIPSIPKALTTLHVQESTADGMGYWKEVTEAARHGKPGYEDWVYAFIPWYMNRLKWRKIPPSNWVPAEHTIRHADLIERTSPEFFDGQTIRVTVDQLYWWETERARHAQNGELASFLTNYPATPEQSFQSPNQGALPVELIEVMEQDIRMPRGKFEIEVAREAHR